MQKKERIITTAVAGIIVLSIAAGAFFYFSVTAQLQKRYVVFQEIIDLIDSDISKGYFRHAAELIGQAESHTHTAISFLRLLKRSRLVSIGLNDYTQFVRISGKGYKDFPGRDDIIALYTYGLMREGRFEEAAIISEKKLTGTPFEGIASEAVVRAGGTVDTIAGIQTPDEYLSLASDSGITSYYVHAALLMLKDGKIDEAFHIIDQHKDDYPFTTSSGRELHLKTAIDKGAFSEALSLIGENESILTDMERSLLLGDIHILQKNWIEAEQLYRDMIQHDFREDHTPYINHPRIAGNMHLLQKQQKQHDIVEWLYQGEELDYRKHLPFIQQNRDAVFSVAGYYQTREDKTAASEILDAYLDTNPDDSIAKLYQLKLSGPISPQQYRSLLWEIILSDQDSYISYRYLAWFLLGIGDFQGIERVMDLWEKVHGETDWSAFYRGVISAEKRDYEEAAHFFSRSYRYFEGFSASYNQALMESVLGNEPAAVSLLEQLLKREESNGNGLNEWELVKIYSRLAQILLKMENKQEAGRMIRKAIQIDPDNSEVLLIRERIGTQ